MYVVNCFQFFKFMENSQDTYRKRLVSCFLKTYWNLLNLKIFVPYTSLNLIFLNVTRQLYGMPK